MITVRSLAMNARRLDDISTITKGLTARTDLRGLLRLLG
jgi:hypothetical protein